MIWGNQVIHHSGKDPMLNCPFICAKLPGWLNEEEGAFRLHGLQLLTKLLTGLLTGG